MNFLRFSYDGFNWDGKAFVKKKNNLIFKLNLNKLKNKLTKEQYHITQEGGTNRQVNTGNFFQLWNIFMYLLRNPIIQFKKQV